MNDLVLLHDAIPPGAVIAYVPPGPEFFAQFAALVAMALTALTSVLLWPVYRVISYFRGNRNAAAITPAVAVAPPAAPQS